MPFVKNTKEEIERTINSGSLLDNALTLMNFIEVYGDGDAGKVVECAQAVANKYRPHASSNSPVCVIAQKAIKYSDEELLLIAALFVQVAFLASAGFAEVK